MELLHSQYPCTYIQMFCLFKPGVYIIIINVQNEILYINKLCETKKKTKHPDVSFYYDGG